MVRPNPHFYKFYGKRNDQLKNASEDFYSRNNISFNRAVKIPANVQKYGIEPRKRGDKLQLLLLVLGIGQEALDFATRPAACCQIDPEAQNSVPLMQSADSACQ
jgi:hypothetical protein